MAPLASDAHTSFTHTAVCLNRVTAPVSRAGAVLLSIPLCSNQSQERSQMSGNKTIMPNGLSSDGKTFVKYQGGAGATEFSVPDGVAEIDVNAFYGCSSLKRIEVAPDNSSYRSIDGVLFTGNGKTLVKYPAGRTQTEYAVPKGTATLETRSFYDCPSLKSVAFPKGLKSIGDWSFAGCSRFLTVRSSRPPRLRKGSKVSAHGRSAAAGRSRRLFFRAASGVSERAPFRTVRRSRPRLCPTA